MDDAGTEHPAGWVLVDGSEIVSVGAGDEPAGVERVDPGGAVVTPPVSSTPTTTCTRRSRGRAHSRPTSSPGCASCIPCGPGSTRRPSTRLRGRVSPSSRCPAARRCSTTTTSSRAAATGSSRRRCRRRVSSASASSHRAGRWTSVSPTVGSRRTSSSRRLDAVLAETERLHGLYHEAGPGARIQIAVAPCSPFSVTSRLMEESAALARRLGLQSSTRTWRRPSRRRRTAASSTAARPSRTSSGSVGSTATSGARTASTSPTTTSRGSAQTGTGVAHCPDVESAARRRRCPCARARRCGCPRGAGRRRVGVERARRPVHGGQAGAARRPGYGAAARR